MTHNQQLMKERVRHWMRERQLDPQPLPPLDQLKHEVGWASMDAMLRYRTKSEVEHSETRDIRQFSPDVTVR
jgi:hypothetical protein